MATYVPIQSVVLSTSASTISFTSLPQDYTDLILVCNAASETTNAFPYIQFNGDTGTSYSMTQMYGNGTSAVSGRVPNTAQMFNSDISLRQSTITGNFTYNIMNYSNSTTFKTSLLRQNSMDASDYVGSLAAVGTWRNTVPVTSIDVKLTRGGTAYNFSVGSTFDLYGVSHNNAKVSSASGGTAVYYDSTYAYHVFTGTGTFTPTRALTADLLVVAGGGGGGNSPAAAGGGAGGVLAFASQSLAAGTSYSVLVGAGGAGGASDGAQGGSGTNSRFASLTASVGGGGGGGYGVALTGGSGGGGGYFNGSNNAVGYPGADGTSGQGNPGGQGYAQSSNHSGGGGGGAGGNGGNASNGGPAGAGGAGTNSVTNWGLLTNALTATEKGFNGYLAGGGGGSFQNTNSANRGAAGSGGGGIGGYNAIPGASAVTNTGSGGGGGSYAVGGNGGSGIVIVRYAR